MPRKLSANNRNRVVNPEGAQEVDPAAMGRHNDHPIRRVQAHGNRRRMKLKMSDDKLTSASYDKTPGSAPPSRPALTLDVAMYEKYLEDSDLTEVQRREFLEGLWQIIVCFVELGFGVHPLQQADEDADGLVDNKQRLIASHMADLVELETTPKTEFCSAVGGSEDLSGGRSKQ